MWPWHTFFYFISIGANHFFLITQVIAFPPQIIQWSADFVNLNNLFYELIILTPPLTNLGWNLQCKLLFPVRTKKNESTMVWFLFNLLILHSDVSMIWPLVRSILYRHQGATQKQWLIMLNLTLWCQRYRVIITAQDWDI